MNKVQLEYFMALARYENISSAAKDLFVSPSTLSKAIAALESELGVPLFSRTGNSLRLNTAGKHYFNRVQQVLLILNDADQEINRLNKTTSTQIYVSTPYKPILSEYTYHFLDNHPKVKIMHQSWNWGQVKNLMDASMLDMAISTHPLETSSLRWDPLFSDRLVLLSTRGTARRFGPAPKLVDLKYERIVFNNSFPDVTMDYIQGCSSLGFIPNTICITDTLSLLLSLVRKQDAVLPVPFYLFQIGNMAQAALECGLSQTQMPLRADDLMLTDIQMPLGKEAIEVGVITPRDPLVNKDAKAFYDGLFPYFQQMIRKVDMTNAQNTQKEAPDTAATDERERKK